MSIRSSMRLVILGRRLPMSWELAVMTTSSFLLPRHRRRLTRIVVVGVVVVVPRARAAVAEESAAAPWAATSIAPPRVAEAAAPRILAPALLNQEVELPKRGNSRSRGARSRSTDMRVRPPFRRLRAHPLPRSRWRGVQVQVRLISVNQVGAIEVSRVEAVGATGSTRLLVIEATSPMWDEARRGTPLRRRDRIALVHTVTRHTCRQSAPTLSTARSCLPCQPSLLLLPTLLRIIAMLSLEKFTLPPSRAVAVVVPERVPW